MWHHQGSRTCQLLRGQQPGHWRHHLPTPEYPQMDVDIARWTDQEPDRLCPYKQEMEGALQDVRVLRGVDAGSDNSLILIKLMFKSRKAKKVEQRSPLLGVQKLNNPVIKRAFQLEVRNRFEELQDQQQLDLCDFNTVMI